MGIMPRYCNFFLVAMVAVCCLPYDVQGVKLGVGKKNLVDLGESKKLPKQIRKLDVNLLGGGKKKKEEESLEQVQDDKAAKAATYYDVYDIAQSPSYVDVYDVNAEPAQPAEPAEPPPPPANDYVDVYNQANDYVDVYDVNAGPAEPPPPPPSNDYIDVYDVNAGPAEPPPPPPANDYVDVYDVPNTPSYVDVYDQPPTPPKDYVDVNDQTSVKEYYDVYGQPVVADDTVVKDYYDVYGQPISPADDYYGDTPIDYVSIYDYGAPGLTDYQPFVPTPKEVEELVYYYYFPEDNMRSGGTYEDNYYYYDYYEEMKNKYGPGESFSDSGDHYAHKATNGENEQISIYIGDEHEEYSYNIDETHYQDPDDYHEIYPMHDQHVDTTLCFMAALQLLWTVLLMYELRNFARDLRIDRVFRRWTWRI